MTAYLTDVTDADENIAWICRGRVYGCEAYPAGATTNSTMASRISGGFMVCLNMEEIGVPLLVLADRPDVDIFDREQVFIDKVLIPTLQRFDCLVVFEHITTAEGVAFVEGSGANIGATIPPITW